MKIAKSPLESVFSLLSVIFLSCLVSTLAACRPANLRPTEELVPNGSSVTEYKVSRGDTLAIQVWGEPRLSGDVVVRDDGNLTMALINDVPADGKTLKELSTEITDRLTQFVPAASVSIAVVATAPIRYYLSGSFTKPGEYRSDKKITLLQAVATGGGFAPFADESSIMLIRKAAATTNGAELRYRLDYNQVIAGKEPNPELKDGDILAIK